MCVIVRTDGEGYTLRKPGYALGRKGPGAGPFMKSYRLEGEELNATLTVINSSAVSCRLPAVWTAGVTTVFLSLDGTGSDAGSWSASTFEYFALLNPAWGRRPYVRESEGSLVVATDRSLFGQALKLSAIIATFTLSATIPGGQEMIIPFSLASLPASLDAKVNITLALPSGGVVSHMRRFLRVPPPVSSSAATTFQVDHERGGILAGGVPYIATGWFAGGYTGEYAGFPLTVSSGLIQSSLEQAGGEASVRNRQSLGLPLLASVLILSDRLLATTGRQHDMARIPRNRPRSDPLTGSFYYAFEVFYTVFRPFCTVSFLPSPVFLNAAMPFHLVYSFCVKYDEFDRYRSPPSGAVWD